MISAVADDAWHGHPETTIDKGFDGVWAVQPSQCYVSGPLSNAWAHITIPMSLVVTVDFLNRNDPDSCKYSTLMKAFVPVR